MIRKAHKALRALTVAALLSCLLVSAASADPRFGLEMTRTAQPTHMGDERLAYRLTVENEAIPNPQVGDTLSCKGANGSGAFAWLRDGTPIPGATEATYLTTLADSGKSIQCMVTATSDPDDVLGHGDLYSPISSAAVSLPPTVIAPAPSSASPSGASQPNISGPSRAATPSGIATTEENSPVLTDVVGAEGTGTFTGGSPVVEGVTMSLGRFEAPQAVDGSCVAPESTISKVEEPAPGTFKVTLSKPATCSGAGPLEAGAFPFASTQEISGECIPPGAEILESTSTGGGSATERFIKMDKAATCSKTGAAITATTTLSCAAPSDWSAGSAITWSFQWLRNGEVIPGATFAEYTAQSTDTEPPSILQCRATAEDEEGGRAVALSQPIHFRPTLPSPYAPPGAGALSVDFENQTTGEVTLDLEAPGGAETSINRVLASGWSCAKAPATTLNPTVTCSRSDTLAPQGSYPPLEVTIALGKNPPTTLLTKAEVSGGGAPDPASAEDEYTIPLPAIPFGFKAFETSVLDEEGNEFTQAGGHPFSAGANIEFNTHDRAGGSVPSLNGSPRVIRTEIPPGFVGNPQATGELCTTPAKLQNCSASSAVGSILVESTAVEKSSPVVIYAVEPEDGTPAQFAFQIAEFVFTLTPELRPEDGYAIDLVTQPLPKSPEVFSSEVTLCSFGVKLLGNEVDRCRKASEPGATERPFLTMPTKCGDPASATTEIFADSWEGDEAQAKHVLSTPEGCDALQFEPTIKARPTTNNADSPTGLDFDLHIPQNEDPEGTATAHLKKAVVTLPDGLVVNPSGANGLGACSEAQVGMDNGVPDNESVKCPDSSKIGAVSVTTPILDHPLPGTLYVAMPHDNPFDSLIALYLVVESPKDGITIKLAGRVQADPNTGQLATTFDQNPQAPVEDVELKVRSGASAPLRTPASCGKYSTTSSLTPWSAPQSGPPATPKDSWQVSRGPSGGACVSSQPNSPSFEAGTASAIAGAFSPFVVKLKREDGSQQFSEVTVSPPPGLLAKLAGTSQCPESALAQAKTKSGKAEQSSPSCPASSELGNVIAAAGAGPAPFQATGKAYLAGPYKGAPLSLAIVTPAVAGPFDLGTVVVRAAAYIDPATAQITVKADPLPTILEGIPLDIRSATVSVDRPSFALNPTSCDPMAVKGSLLSTLGQSAALESRFQLGECTRLGFKPNLKLKLHGKTNRGAYQRLQATLTARPGDANIASASVTLPKSAFLAQEHIRTVCTRVQFAADACPNGSIYGRAEAITPLLDQPLSGPVYLRSSNNKLPDLVVALKGPDSLPIEVELAGRTDSKKGALRNTFDLVPDAPVTKFSLELFGGKKGLVVNSRNLCGGIQRASVELAAQNGKQRSFRPVVGNNCPKARKKGKGQRRSQRKR